MTDKTSSFSTCFRIVRDRKSLAVCALVSDASLNLGKLTRAFNCFNSELKNQQFLASRSYVHYRCN